MARVGPDAPRPGAQRAPGLGGLLAGEGTRPYAGTGTHPLLGRRLCRGGHLARS